MLHRILLLILAVLALQSCNINTSGTWKNGRIDNEKRTQIRALNEKLFKAIMSKDMVTTRSLMSDVLLKKDGNKLDSLLLQVSNVIKTQTFTVLEEYNVSNSSKGVENSVTSAMTGDQEFKITYQALNKDMYTSLLLLHEPERDLIMTVIYGKYGKEWKVNILQFGQYRLFGKTAPEYYRLARANLDKGLLIDAACYIDIASQCSNPGNGLIQYTKNAEMTSFYDKVMKQAGTRWTFPMILENIPTKPEIYRIYPRIMSDGFFPNIVYRSVIDLKDTVALKAENEKVKQEVNTIFEGINKDKKYVLYQAINGIPDGKTILKHYGFVDKLTK